MPVPWPVITILLRSSTGPTVRGSNRGEKSVTTDFRGAGTIPGEVAELGPAGQVSLDPQTGQIDLGKWGREGLGVIPYWSLAGGFLTGKYHGRDDDAAGPRAGGVRERYFNAAWVELPGRYVPAAGQSLENYW